MGQHYGMTAELYRAVTAVVDDRMREVTTRREDFDRLVEAQVRTEDRLDRVEAALDRLAQAQARTEQRVDELAQAQVRTEERVTSLEAAVEKLAQAQARTEEELRNLIEVVAVMQGTLAAVQDRQQGMQDTLAAVKGRQLELTYRQKAAAYFGPLLRRMRVRSLIELEDDLESKLPAEEFDDLLRLDLLVSGQPRRVADAPPVWLALEISSVVDRYDVDRALRRAAALRRAGYRAIPVVAGERATEGAEDKVRSHRILLFQDGKTLFWEEALADALVEEGSR